MVVVVSRDDCGTVTDMLLPGRPGDHGPHPLQCKPTSDELLQGQRRVPEEWAVLLAGAGLGGPKRVHG